MSNCGNCRQIHDPESWVETTHTEERETDDLEIVTPAERKKNERSKEVEMGLEPEYDYPECDRYFAPALTTSPHAFIDHL